MTSPTPTNQITVQINGRIHAEFPMPVGADKWKTVVAAEGCIKPEVRSTIVRVVFVPGKVVNFVCAHDHASPESAV